MFVLKEFVVEARRGFMFVWKKVKRWLGLEHISDCLVYFDKSVHKNVSSINILIGYQFGFSVF